MDIPDNLPYSDEINKVLEQVDFPASKDQIIQKAEDTGAGEDVKGLLQKLPDQQFQSPEDVVSKIEGDIKNLGGINL